jgi:hypothetical protein
VAPPSVGSPEIYDLCFEIYATKRWSYERIAEHLFHKHGVVSATDPTKPVHKKTIGVWIRQVAADVSAEASYRRDVEAMLAGRELDDLAELLYDEQSRLRIETMDDLCKFIDAALRIGKERRSTFGVYAPKQREVTHHGNVEIKGLDPKTEELLERLERQVEENRARRNAS